jgi:hypothetical protein
MTPLPELAKLLEASTARPWSIADKPLPWAQEPGKAVVHVAPWGTEQSVCVVTYAPDAALIAALRNAAPRLLAVVEAARALVETYGPDGGPEYEALSKTIAALKEPA